MSDSLSDDAFNKKVRQIPGDELLDHTKFINTKYNHSQNSLIIGPSIKSNVIKALTSSEDTLFYKDHGHLTKGDFKSNDTRYF